MIKNWAHRYAEENSLDYASDTYRDAPIITLSWWLSSHQNQIQIAILVDQLELTLRQMSRMQVIRHNLWLLDNLLNNFLPFPPIRWKLYGMLPINIDEATFEKALDDCQELLLTDLPLNNN